MGETRKLAAILVADVVGYSRLARRTRIAPWRACGASQRSDRSRDRAHHGRIVKRTGDGLSPSSAASSTQCAARSKSRSLWSNATRVSRRTSASSSGSAFISATSSRRPTATSWATASISPRDWKAIAAPGAICLSEDAYRQVKGRLDLRGHRSRADPTQEHRRADRVYSLQVGVPAQARAATPVAPSAPKSV